MAIKPALGNDVSKPGVKRMRWATQRVTSMRARGKRNAITDRFHRGGHVAEKKRISGGTDSGDGSNLGGAARAASAIDEDQGSNDDDTSPPRRMFFNIPLPDDARDMEGRPIAHFTRNKIRTSKYTPLSFVPKNLWYQFHNIANIYFLILIILAFFPIFGASDPGLGAVPLLFILLVTGIKDAIEDWRRTVLDNELNNSPVHRLVDWNNVNTSEDKISLWRRTKKASTRGVMSFVSLWQRKKKDKSVGGKTYTERALDEPRRSVETRRTIRDSVAFSRNSIEEEGIQMTPVPSPLPRSTSDGGEVTLGRNRSNTGFSYEDGELPTGAFDGPLQEDLKDHHGTMKIPVKFHGSLINPLKQIPEKARFKKDFWKNVQVGDFVRIYNDDQIPADIVILSTSDPDGACYVETKNLDGETNFKVRNALQSGKKAKHARDCERMEFLIESEPPHANLYQYSGVVRWRQRDIKKPEREGTETSEPISINNLLLRGCSLRNTEWVLGVVIFTGEETKIMINSGVSPRKRSRMTRELNWNVVYNFMILLGMCIVSGVVNGVTWGEDDHSFDFFEYGSIGKTPALNGFITFWTCIILFQNLVPISLYITLEIIKTAQAFFIYSDTFMYYEKLDYPCTPKSWNISDDVGQIEYVFSDKTGTLTQNVMEFKKATINGVPYGEAYTEAQAGMQRRQGINVEIEGAKAHKQIALDRIKMLEALRKIHKNPYLHDDELTFVAPDFVADLNGAAGNAQRIANQDFMLALALCHTVITEKTPGDPPKIEFKAQSPDEAALVGTARDCGFTVLGRSQDGIFLNVLGKEEEYKILNTLEFNSSRKRMSAIVRKPDGRIVLYCKGADSVIYSRLKKSEQAQLRRDTAEHLETFAREGLRTLCIAQRILGEDEYQTWNKEHDIAAAAVYNREDKLEIVSDAIERELTLLGGTAIEDRLQDGVPDTIALLGDAGIKLWVLTGDKVETAINIGFSCNLLNNDMDLIVFKTEDDDIASARVELDKCLTKFNITGSDAELKAARKNHEPPDAGHAIVIDGDALKLVLTEELRQKFLLLCKQCKSVLCCRVSPSQKAAVVQMVKIGLDVMTLSIGDGANDVAMIQEADVGVGIAGEEGRQAVMSSDYAIGQFRFLQRLVLVHGRWSYRRLAETIANFFYKVSYPSVLLIWFHGGGLTPLQEMVWTFVLFWYQLYNNFDGSYFFDYTYILLVNTVFTSVPVALMGILDQDVSDKVSLAVPQLYRRGIERKEWTQTKFWLYMFDGIYQSLICFFMAYLLFSPATFVTSNGLGLDDRERMGVYVACATIFVINFYILMNTYRWDWLMVLIVVISILLIWFWTGVYSSFPSASSIPFYMAGAEAYGQLSFWVLSFLTIIICLLPRFVCKSFQKIFFPRVVDIVREQIRQGKFAYLDQEENPTPVSEKVSSAGSSDTATPGKAGRARSQLSPDDDTRPMYPPSVAATGTTHNPRSQNGSDGTDFTGHRTSLEQPPRFSLDRPRPSFERLRQSMDKTRPSFEASDDFTSAAMLTRVESSHSQTPTQRMPHGSSSLR
ncbi:hypothetical protein MMC18_000152 [Xylographa bjoerkii]|nr:hypothetical protein [Xylographa bjoerkii]